jgi:hypothetical protein
VARRIKPARSGPVSIPIYHTPTGSYDAFTVAWQHDGRTLRKKFSDLDKARAFAEARASDIAQGRASTNFLTHDQIQEYLAAKKLAGRESLIEIARTHAARRSRSAVSISEAIAAFLEFKRNLPRRRALHPEYLPKIQSRLHAFAAVFRCHLHELKAGQIQDWLNNLPGSLRTKNNHFDDLRMLIRHAIRQRWLAPDFDEIGRVTLERSGPGKIHPYTPEEAAAILKHARTQDLRWLPWIPLRLFSGLRSEESLRVTPDHIHDTGWIAAGTDITKTEQRRLLPVLPNLRAWLDAYPPGDIIAPYASIHSLTRALVKMIRKSGVETRHNGFRDSFVSYRMAIICDAAKVSEETGHSITQLRASYREIRLPDGRIITPDLAAKYFGLVPPSFPKPSQNRKLPKKPNKIGARERT